MASPRIYTAYTNDSYINYFVCSILSVVGDFPMGPCCPVFTMFPTTRFALCAFRVQGRFAALAEFRKDSVMRSLT